MGNHPVAKKVNTPKSKYLGKYLLRKYPARMVEGNNRFTFGIRFLRYPYS